MHIIHENGRRKCKQIVREDKGLHIYENIIDIPTFFDSLWNNCGWPARREIVNRS